MDRFIDRRLFLRLSGMSLALSVAGPAAARRLETVQRRAGGQRLPQPGPGPSAQTDVPTLVTIFLRGGADGLNVIVPTESGEHGTYLGFRRTIAVQLAEMQAAGTILTDASGADTQWGLHPSAASIMPLWESGGLALLPDVHYDNGSRSHFDSQQFYENGTPGQKFTPDGWANRHLRTSGSGDPLLRAISFDTTTPFAMVGSYPTLTFSSLSDLTVSPNGSRNSRFLDNQELVYPGVAGGPRAYDAEVAAAGENLIGAIRAIQDQVLPAPSVTYDTAAPYGYFGTRLRDLASLIKTDAFRIEMAEIDLHGWDTHNAQAGAHPALTQVLASQLKAFHDDLGETFMRNVVIFVVSEFGRTCRENGSAGTDHGSATMAWVIGHPSRVLGRRVVTNWFGLDDLRDDRDLRHSYDFRDVVGELVARHLGNPAPDLFPGWTPTPVGLIA